VVRSFGGFADFALETGVGSHEAGVAGIDAGFGRGGDHRVSFVAPDSGLGGWWRQNREERAGETPAVQKAEEDTGNGRQFLRPAFWRFCSMYLVDLTR